MKPFPMLAVGVLLSALVCTPAVARQMSRSLDQADMTVSAADRNTVINGLIKEMHESYIFPELANKVDLALRSKQKKGAYDTITSARQLSQTLSRELQEVTHDKHLNVHYSEQPVPERKPEAKPSAEALAQDLQMMKERNFGVERIERLPFNIGYLELGMFATARDAASTLAATMTVLANTDALIIDLRRNGGGDPATVTLLASYLLDERTHMTDIYYRRGNRTEQMWSLDAVPGKHYGSKKDVYVLTSARTFSAAEDFSYALKNLKRVTVVGETTAGGAHPGDFMRVAPHFTAFIPNGRSIGPVTKSNWEAVGVAPDVSVPAKDALNTAQLAILKKMAASEQQPGKLQRLNERIVNLGSDTVAAN